MIDIEIVKDEIVKRLKSLQPEKIILFGSYAYGNPDENSDIDLCVISNSIESKSKERAKIRSLLRNIKISKDILVEDSDYFLSHSGEDWINTALYDAANRGILLYEKV
jgi:predicted nucleotidyltransferase